MPIFTYKAKDRKGELLNGTLESESRAAVSMRLQAMGYFPLEILSQEKSGGGSIGGFSFRRAPKVRTSDLANFYRQMSDLIGAGVPLVKALTTVKSQTPNPTLTTILSQVNSDVQGGDTFASALGKHTKVFGKLTEALVRVGETGGMLDETLSRIADYSETEDELKSKIKSTMAYPVLLFFFGIGVVAFLLTYVMPRILVVFKDMKQTLPATTMSLIWLSDFLKEWWYLVIVAIALAVFSFRRWTRTDAGGLLFHRFLLKVPKLGDLILKRQISAFTRTLGSLLRNGVPILNALSIASEVITIRPVQMEVLKIPDSITQGAGMANTLRQSPLFPPVVVNMVAIGEETGHLPDVLLRVATAYETQVERDIKMLTSLIEPLIILVMAAFVGYIVMAMLLPLFSFDPTGGE